MRHGDMERLEAFTRDSHSLRVSVSNIAAMCGFHPWKNLPELFLMNLVYQGSLGQELLRRDSELLGLELISQEERLLDLARKSGAMQAVEAALAVKKGTVTSIQVAAQVKKRAIEIAAKKLSPSELKELQEGVRSAVDTGFGTALEDNALDLYQQKTGWPVEERNAEIRIWPFQISGEDTVIPIHPAMPAQRSNLSNSSQKPHSENTPIDLTLEDEIDNTLPQNSIQGSTEETISKEKPLQPPVEQISNKAFFSILGSVDGIREELFINGEDHEEDDWVIQKVIVECKHRMNRITPVPPLFEQIQTTAYCLMYDVNEADIVQVLRTGKAERPVRKRAKRELVSNSPEKQATLDNWVKNNTLDKNESSKVESMDAANITISVSRILLDDPVMQHRKQWNQVILPRLRNFVEAVYRVRDDDDRRYRMLSALAEQAINSIAPWNLLFQECPWLKDCDTAFQKI